MIKKSSVNAKHLEKYAKYYDPGVLDPEYHYQLVLRLNEVASTSNISRQWIYQHRMSKFCTDEEVDYVRGFRRGLEEGTAGFAIYGSSHGVDDHMAAMCGAFLRNYIDARVHTVQNIIDALRTSTLIPGTVILIPNMVSAGNAKGTPDWQASLLFGWLLERYTNQKPVVAYVRSPKALRAQWGPSVADHFTHRFDSVTLQDHP